MDWILRSRWGSNLLLIAASAAVPAAGVHFLVNEGTAPISGTGHLIVMAVGASVAAWRASRSWHAVCSAATAARSSPAARSPR